MNYLNISFKFGIFTAILLIAYFLILGWLGVNSNPFFSFANALITASGLALAIRELKEKSDGRIAYKTGFQVAFVSGIIATALFSVFFITYYVYVPHFADALLKNIGNFANTGGVFITVITMGVVTSMVVSFALMQLHKRKIHTNPPENKEPVMVDKQHKNI